MKKIVTILAIVLLGLVVFSSLNTEGNTLAQRWQGLFVENFEECVEAGFPVDESDPPRCSVSAEKIFIGPRQPAVNSDTAEAPAEENENTPENDEASGPSETQVPGATISEADSDALAEPAVPPAAASGGTFDPLATPPAEIPGSVRLEIPFTSQAPFGNWNPPYDEACEEASLLMAEYALRGAALSPETADREIVAMTEWVTQNGYAIDATAAEVAEIARNYLHRQARVYTGSAVTVANLKALLAAGYPVIIPAAGQLLGNPYFSGDGPPYHMLILTGYDANYFYTNDPGTRRGEDYRYAQDTILNVIHDWNGSKETITSGQKAILVIGV